MNEQNFLEGYGARLKNVKFLVCSGVNTKEKWQHLHGE